MKISMVRYIYIVWCVFWLALAPGAAQDSSSMTVAGQQMESDQAAAETQEAVDTRTSSARDVASSSVRITELNKALFELNAKMEALIEKQIQLTEDIESVRKDNARQEKIMLEQSMRQVDGEKVRALQTSLDLIRAEITQIREDIGVLEGELKRKTTVARNGWYRSRWITFASLGMSCLALLIAL